MIGCAVAQEVAWDDLLSIRGIENVLGLVGQVWELTAETLCVMCPSRLHCFGPFSLQLAHREEGKTRLSWLAFLLLDLDAFLKKVSMHL